MKLLRTLRASAILLSFALVAQAAGCSGEVETECRKVKIAEQEETVIECDDGEIINNGDGRATLRGKNCRITRKRVAGGEYTMYLVNGNWVVTPAPG